MTRKCPTLCQMNQNSKSDSDLICLECLLMDKIEGVFERGTLELIEEEVIGDILTGGTKPVEQTDE